MKKSKADSSSLETSLCLLFLYMLNVFSDPVSIISWFSFVCLLPLPLLRARILCLVLSPLLPSLWLMIVLHLSLIDLTCPWLISPVLCSVLISSSVLSSSLSDSLLSILMCLLCFPVVPLLDFWILLVVLFILCWSEQKFSGARFPVRGFTVGLSVFIYYVRLPRLSDCCGPQSFQFLIHTQPDVLWHKKLCPNMKQSRTAVNPESGNTLNSQQISFILCVSPGSLWYKVRHWTVSVRINVPYNLH